MEVGGDYRGRQERRRGVGVREGIRKQGANVGRLVAPVSVLTFGI